jgi:hypothetical protein
MPAGDAKSTEHARGVDEFQRRIRTMAPTPPPYVLPEAWNIWLRTFRYPPEVIYHYTSVDALLSILATKRMWATNLLYTNDPTDLTHGERIIGAALDEAMASCSNAFTCKWLDCFKQTTRINLERNDRYSISFCTNGDLLSQWRGYGAAGGGFAMGWDSVSEFPGLPMRVGITYDEQTQQTVVRDIITTHVEHVAGIGSTPDDAEFERLKYATGSLGVYLSLCLSYFKHPAFTAEDEFRWVYEALDHALPEGLQLFFRRFGTIVKPYVEVDFSRGKLIEVIYGPTNDPSTAAWLRSALDRFGFQGTVVKPSSVPMRA